MKEVKHMKVLNYLNKVSEINLNEEFYDINKQNNGGGYYQPCYIYDGLFNGKKINVQIRDTSCGELGSRYSVEVYYNNTVTEYYYNSMNNHVEEFGNIESDIADFIYEWSNYWCAYDVSKDASYDDVYIEY